MPLGQGEYDEPIGLPLVVVCQNVSKLYYPDLFQVDKMDLLEREMGYKEELFDFMQQFLRTILLKRNPLNLRQLIFRRRIFTLPLTRSPSIPFILTIPLITAKRSPPTNPSSSVRRTSSTKRY